VKRLMSLKVDMASVGTTLVVRLKGELDHHTSEQLKQKLEREIAGGGVENLVLSLKELTFMDSSGLGVILGRYKQISGRGGKMVVCDVAPSVHRLFDMSGLFKILQLEQNESDALLSLGVVS